ncbi:SRPBCC family protein [Bdellovibrio svalbardensis]|uniref:SRPBCC family protein n=1 Tax=Bdellovibrio svalbardensis TaxID=2972972 RepID=A0ABT6DE93_9BACT|nr:SRPBCC family protein [Bdellovibrio svalbardensis]MDG0815155.1 SRPBCC family protein [Bdellovibrio svalbardensis]
MLGIIGLVVLALVVIFVIFISTRPSSFKYERSDLINASADKIFPYLINFKLAGQWSPYEQMDPKMKKNYGSVDGQVGSWMSFDGNKDAGTGNLEILQIVPNESVQIKLQMLKPFEANNLVEYKLTPEGSGTRFTWTMSGQNQFLGKMITVFIDCDKMLGDQFLKGISNLKNIVENNK